MSQQEFVPESQAQQSRRKHALNDDELYHPQYPYNWSPNKAGAPRDEPPSSYDEPMIQRGYQAQNDAAGTKRRAWAPYERSAPQRQRFSPDGDAYEQGYRSYNVVPPWARVQPRKKNVARLVLLIVLGLILIKPILVLLAFLLVAVASIVGLTFLAIVLPLILVVGIVTILLFILRVAFWQNPRRYRPPWGW
jgi:hypothetical protein